MKNKHCIIKIIVMMAVICLLGINYGYWSERLTVNGKASLLVQVSVVDLVKTETVTKEGKPINMQTDDKIKESNENNIDMEEKQEKDTSKDLLKDEPSDIEKIDLKDNGQKENNEIIIDEEVNEDTTLEEDVNNEISEMNKDIEIEEHYDEEKLEINDVIKEDKDNENPESNNTLDVEVDGEELVE